MRPSSKVCREWRARAVRSAALRWGADRRYSEARPHSQLAPLAINENDGGVRADLFALDESLGTGWQADLTLLAGLKGTAVNHGGPARWTGDAIQNEGSGINRVIGGYRSEYRGDNRLWEERISAFARVAGDNERRLRNPALGT